MPTRTSGTLKNIDRKRYLWNAQLSLVGGLAKRRVSAKFLNNLMVYRYSSVTGTGTTGQLGQVRLAISFANPRRCQAASLLSARSCALLVFHGFGLLDYQ